MFLLYNEEESLERVLDTATAYGRERLTANGIDWEIVLVDDGSTDASPEIAAAWSRGARGPGDFGPDARIRVVTHERNRGMGAGMASGIRAAQKDVLVFLPADGQTPVHALDRMVPLLDTADIVVTIYDNARESMIRSGLSAGLRAYMRMAAGIDFRLEGLYLFPVQAAKEIAPQIRAETFFFSFELIDRGLARGLTLAETTMSCLPRTGGRSKVANLRRIRRVAREVARYAANKRLGL